jgi:hypothetical protein
MRVAVQTTTLPREQIYWLEEWVKYHLWLGFDHVFIYDNTGSVAYEYSALFGQPTVTTDGRNYKGHEIRAMTGHLTDADVADIVKQIGEKYAGRVTITPWLPLNAEGKPFYGQTAAMEHFLVNHGPHYDWVLFVDLDEYLVNPDWRTWLEHFEAHGRNEVLVGAKLFRERITGAVPTIPTQSITQSYPDHWDRQPKRFAKCADVIQPGVHYGGKWRQYHPAHDTCLYLHHYRVERRQEITRMEHDDTLAKIIPELRLDGCVPVPRKATA